MASLGGGLPVRGVRISQLNLESSAGGHMTMPDGTSKAVEVDGLDKAFSVWVNSNVASQTEQGSAKSGEGFGTPVLSGRACASASASPMPEIDLGESECVMNPSVAVQTELDESELIFRLDDINPEMLEYVQLMKTAGSREAGVQNRLEQITQLVKEIIEQSGEGPLILYKTSKEECYEMGQDSRKNYGKLNPETGKYTREHGKNLSDKVLHDWIAARLEDVSPESKEILKEWGLSFVAGNDAFKKYVAFHELPQKTEGAPVSSGCLDGGNLASLNPPAWMTNMREDK